MAITAYTGLPRNGKSYGVFENVIIPALKQGRPVFTNIPFVSDVLIDKTGFLPIPFDSKDIQNNPNWFQEVFEPGALFVVDEAWRIWQGGTKANQIPEGHKSFFAEHGHMVGTNGFTTEIVIVTQDLNQLASYVRSLVETTYRAVKLSAIGANTKFRIDIYAGAVTGQNPPKNQIIRQTFGTFKPEVYDCYKSATMSETGNVGDENTSDDRANLLKGYLFKMVPVIFIIGGIVVYLGYKTVAGFFGADESEPTYTEQSAEVEQVTARSPRPQARKPENPDHLKGRDLTIVSNNGRKPSEYDYVIEAKKGDSWYRLTKPELLKLGYTLRPINQCFAILEINSASYAVTCRKQESKSVVDFNFGSNQQDDA